MLIWLTLAGYLSWFLVVLAILVAGYPDNVHLRAFLLDIRQKGSIFVLGKTQNGQL